MPRKSKSVKRSGKQSEPKTASSPPLPFLRAPDVLEALLPCLVSDHIYILHVDHHPPAFKRRIFLVPVLLHVAVAIALLYRFILAVPSYGSILLAALGQTTSASLDLSATPRSVLFSVIVKRAAMFMADWILFRFLLPWPLNFFFGRPSNPVAWRTKIGFRDEEIIVRVSRSRWDSKLGPNWIEEVGKEELIDPDTDIFQTRIVPVINEDYLAQKTGYVMMDKNWDLDFATMITATQLVDSGKMSKDVFQKTILVYSETYGGWLVWNVPKPSKSDEQASTSTNTGDVVEWRKKLTQLGKEDLFYRWIELIQYESTQPGGFTEDRQRSVMKQTAELFRRHGLDFEGLQNELAAARGSSLETP